MKTLRNSVALLGLAVVCLFAACSDGADPTSSPAGARRTLLTDSTQVQSTTTTDTTTTTPPSRGGIGAGSGG